MTQLNRSSNPRYKMGDTEGVAGFHRVKGDTGPLLTWRAPDPGVEFLYDAVDFNTQADERILPFWIVDINQDLWGIRFIPNNDIDGGADGVTKVEIWKCEYPHTSMELVRTLGGELMEGGRHNYLRFIRGYDATNVYLIAHAANSTDYRLWHMDLINDSAPTFMGELGEVLHSEETAFGIGYVDPRNGKLRSEEIRLNPFLGTDIEAGFIVGSGGDCSVQADPSMPTGVGVWRRTDTGHYWNFGYDDDFGTISVAHYCNSNFQRLTTVDISSVDWSGIGSVSGENLVVVQNGILWTVITPDGGIFINESNSDWPYALQYYADGYTDITPDGPFVGSPWIGQEGINLDGPLNLGLFTSDYRSINGYFFTIKTTATSDTFVPTGWGNPDFFHGYLTERIYRHQPPNPSGAPQNSAQGDPEAARLRRV